MCAFKISNESDIFWKRVRSDSLNQNNVDRPLLDHSLQASIVNLTNKFYIKFKIN